jgi:hypothetical protein
MKNDRLPYKQRQRLHYIQIRLNNGFWHGTLGGKRLRRCRHYHHATCVAFRLGRRYRAIMEKRSDGYYLLWFGTHENYNTIIG